MEVKPHYIHTELGIIPNTWKIVHLQDVIDKVIDNRGKTPPLSNNGFPLLEVSVFTNKNKPELGKVSKYVDSKTFHSWFRSGHPKCNDIIVPTVGTIGTAAIIDRDGLCIAQNVVGLQIKPENDPYYILCQIKSDSFVRQIKAVMMSAVQPSLKVPYLLTSKLLIPRFEEQQKIAECIGNIDSLITSLEKLIEKKKNIKQGMMQELLTGKRRLPGFTGEWKKTSLGKLVSMRVVSLGRGVVISKISINACKGDYPIYSSSILNNGLFGYWGNYMFDEEMITWSVDGGGDFFHRKKHRYSVTNVCGYMRVDQSKICYGFLYYQLSLAHSSLVFDYTIKAHPSVVKKLYSVWMPPIHEQIAIYGALNDIDDDINTLIIKLAKYKQIKKGMMQELLTGRIRLL